jgi:hypothetical protein
VKKWARLMADDTVNIKIVAETTSLDQLSAKIDKASVDLSKFGRLSAC